MLNVPRNMTKVSQTLLKKWGAVQYTVRLYNLAQDNLIPVNPLHFSEDFAIDKPL